MKRILILVLVCVTLNSFGQKSYMLNQAKVDKRVEILSIIFRLAECREYSSEKFKLYTDKIYEYYEPYKDHEIIHFIKQLRKDNRVAYDAVMSMAIHLNDNYSPLVEFTNEIPESRWGKDNAQRFVQLLQQFIVDSNSEQFFRSNHELYENASERFLPVFKKLDINWYKAFYGKESNDKFNIIIGLGNGRGNYGPSIDYSNGQREIYAILGTQKTDSLGMVEFPEKGYLPILLHEFNHSFVNYLIEKNSHLFEENGKILYQAVKNSMRSQAYGNWQTMLNESLVRAAVIKYMKDHNFDSEIVEDEIESQFRNGFLWIKELVSELQNYDRQRNQYPTLEEYLPNLAKSFSAYADDIETYIKEFDKLRPKVVSINEFRNGDQNVKSDIDRVTINFDRKLSGRGHSINYGSKGKDTFPNFGKIYYSEDKEAVIIEMQLESQKEYEFVLTGLAFKTPDGISMNNYEIRFKTK